MIIIQLTGLSGSGKSTIANAVSERLKKNNYKVEIIDGDDYRKILCKDLGFSKEDRNENIRRLGFVANILSKHEIITIIAAINPYEDLRNEIKSKYNNVYNVWIKCDLEELKIRDTKKLYYRALLPKGHPERIDNLTGVNDPYEIPKNPDLIIDTTNLSVEESFSLLYRFIEKMIHKTGEYSNLELKY